MKIRRSSSCCCPNPACSFDGQYGKGNIIRHSFYTTTQGRRRRYRCKECGRTFSSTHGSSYYRLHKRRSLFDEVILMCVNGLGIKAMARVKQISWGTVARWLESAARYAERFNASRISYDKTFLPRSIHDLPFIFLYCIRRKKLWIRFQTVSIGLLEGVVKTQQHFPGEAPYGLHRDCNRWQNHPENMP